MNNEELFSQVLDILKQHTLSIDSTLKDFKEELYSQVLDVIKQQTMTLEGMMQENNEKLMRRVEIYIENNVTKRLDSLADGYMLTHEKQQVQGQEIEILKDQVSNIKLRVLALENKGARRAHLKNI